MGRIGAALHRHLRHAGQRLAIVVDGRALHARADAGARAVPLVLQALEQRGIAVESVTVARPSLDDVYLRYAGRRFETTETATQVVARR